MKYVLINPAIPYDIHAGLSRHPDRATHRRLDARETTTGRAPTIGYCVYEFGTRNPIVGLKSGPRPQGSGPRNPIPAHLIVRSHGNSNCPESP